jgi:antitoxin (DNA-binding transcriptional repressor) of toxin-antitoxin stability system
MAKLKTVGVREFRDHATTYLSGSDPVAVSKHGRVVGFYIPLQRDEDEVPRALARLGEAVSQVLDETGLSEEELAQMFDLRQRHAE